MIKIIDNQKLELHYKEGFGSWTYHLKFPGTADIKGRWGHLKLSGTFDDFAVSNIYLAPRKDLDMIISIYNVIRDAIGKSGGDIVTVTLYLHD